MKSIARMALRDVPDKSFVSVEKDEEDILYIYQKLRTVGPDKHHDTEEVTFYARGGFPCWTEDTHMLVYVYDTKEVAPVW